VTKVGSRGEAGIEGGATRATVVERDKVFTPASIARVSSAALRDSAVACLPGAPIPSASAGVAKDLGGLGGLGRWQSRAHGARSTSARSRTSPARHRRPLSWLLLSQLLLSAVLAGFLSQTGHTLEGARAASKSKRRGVEAWDIFGTPRISWDSLRRIGWMSNVIGGEEVELLNDSHYAGIRAMCGVTITDLAQNVFCFSNLEKGGGKGSSFTRDLARVSPIWLWRACHPDSQQH